MLVYLKSIPVQYKAVTCTSKEHFAVAIRLNTGIRETSQITAGLPTTDSKFLLPYIYQCSDTASLELLTQNYLRVSLETA
jgi:hypothetical protein